MTDYIEKIREATADVAAAERAAAKARVARRALSREAVEHGITLTSLEEPWGASRQAIVKDMERYA